MWRDFSDWGNGVGRAHDPLSSALYLSVTLPPSLTLASPGFPSPPLVFETLCQGPFCRPHCGGEKKGARCASGLMACHSLHGPLSWGSLAVGLLAHSPPQVSSPTCSLSTLEEDLTTPPPPNPSHMCPEGPGPELQPTAMLKSTPEDRKQVREWRKAARLLQHPLPVRPGGGSLGRRGSAGQRGPGGLPLSCPTRITLPPPCRSFTPCNCHCEPWKMGLGPGRRLAATGWPSVIKGEAGTSVCSFCGRHCPPGGC